MTDPNDRGLGPLDTNGFLTDPTLWDPHLAKRLASHLGISGLDAAHWDAAHWDAAHWHVIERLRFHWLSEGGLPVQRILCRRLGLSAHCVDQLFGGLVEAWKIAGLPDPGEEGRVYMENMEIGDTITD